MHVFPFLAVTLVVAQYVIEKSRLPKRSFLGCFERDSDCSLQPIHPLRELKVIPRLGMIRYLPTPTPIRHDLGECSIRARGVLLLNLRSSADEIVQIVMKYRGGL